ncbi:hypothetical protein PR202_gb11801 [Eleusine coracana subsp. coracana]|uniref:F-box domain-containing protein n=1 Tax=Eleusine coracana subsp. coracana TaxID=191504 RepID=A0AAV5END0_ELECO|nr:hypothetical protein PR202_gb11801 [Eleusine coracana subsp. coracana]
MLPDDVLAEVFDRLAPCSLAIFRGICKAWRTLVDGRRLLHKDLLPLSMARIFINYNERPYVQLLFCPCPCTELFPPWRSVVDHCNGLLLLVGGVLNPATGQWVPLPEPPLPCKGMERFTHNMYLVFHPFVSSDIEVFLIRRVPDRGDYDDIIKYGTDRW